MRRGRGRRLILCVFPSSGSVILSVATCWVMITPTTGRRVFFELDNCVGKPSTNLSDLSFEVG